MRAVNRASKAVPTDWHWHLPMLCGERVRLRELRLADAPSLLEMLTAEAVTRFTSPPPTTIEHFERFIGWTLKHRTAGDFLCFAVTVNGSDQAVGIFQIRRLDKQFEAAEWGFALGTAYWGAGVFEEGAKLILDFVFNVLGVHRLEARAALLNGRGNAALLKMGAVPEGVLRKSFQRDGQYLDQVLYATLREDWLAAQSRSAATTAAAVAARPAIASPRADGRRASRSLSLVPAGAAHK